VLDPVPPQPQTPPRSLSPSAPRQSPTARTQPIPNHVAQILIRHARTTVDTCPISLEPYDACLDLSITSCFHIFKTDAIQRWMETNHDLCPVCRSRIENVIVEDLNN
jgi:SUMO ligase MMS21 Smc5/6 complex component